MPKINNHGLKYTRIYAYIFSAKNITIEYFFSGTVQYLFIYYSQYLFIETESQYENYSI